MSANELDYDDMTDLEIDEREEELSRDVIECDPGYHKNDFGELIPHAITVTPLDVRKFKVTPW